MIFTEVELVDNELYINEDCEYNEQDFKRIIEPLTYDEKRKLWYVDNYYLLVEESIFDIQEYISTLEDLIGRVRTMAQRVSI